MSSLFTPNSRIRLCRVLNIPYEEPQWEQKLNVSRTDTALPEDVLAELGQWQAPALAAVRQECPQLDLDRFWPTAVRWCPLP